MIKVVVKKTDDYYTSIEVSGHAGSGDAGYDLVCAGVSSIMTGALNAFDSLTDGTELKLDPEPRITIELNNNIEINQMLFRMVLIQLQTVEFAHPEYIRILEKEVTS